MTKQTVAEFMDQVGGRPAFRDTFGRSLQLIQRAIDTGLMPTHWYLDIRDWCVERDIEVPEHLFRWSKKRPSPKPDKQYAHSAAENQVASE